MSDTTAIAKPMLGSEQMALISRTIAKGCTPDELRLFGQICERTGLDPFARQIYAVKRWDRKENREIMQTQISIDGARLVAQRSGKYAGQDGPYYCGEDGQWRDVWLSAKPPMAARVGVFHRDFAQPLYAVALWSEYCQTNKDGGPSSMWAKFATVMLAKCAEMLALRKAFPAELSGLYSAEEMSQAESEPPQRAGSLMDRLKPLEPVAVDIAKVDKSEDGPWSIFVQSIEEHKRSDGSSIWKITDTGENVFACTDPLVVSELSDAKRDAREVDIDVVHRSNRNIILSAQGKAQ